MKIAELGALIDALRRFSSDFDENCTLRLRFNEARELADEFCLFGGGWDAKTPGEILDAMMDEKRIIQAFGCRLTTTLPKPPLRIDGRMPNDWMGR